MSNERQKIEIKHMWAIDEMKDIPDLTEWMKTLPIDLQSGAASALKKAYLVGFNSALQYSSSHANNKGDYATANEILKIGTQLV